MFKKIEQNADTISREMNQIEILEVKESNNKLRTLQMRKQDKHKRIKNQRTTSQVSTKYLYQAPGFPAVEAGPVKSLHQNHIAA